MPQPVPALLHSFKKKNLHVWLDRDTKTEQNMEQLDSPHCWRECKNNIDTSEKQFDSYLKS